MNNYLSEVRKNLHGIPEDDVNDMLQFYEEYFYDAALTDAEAEHRYGSPKRFAQALKMNYYLDQDDAAINQAQATNDKPKNRGRLVWMIILGLFASPILVPLALAAVVVIFALLIAMLAVIISIYAVVLSLIGAGLTAIFMSLTVITQGPATALFALGMGLAALGLGLILAPFLLKFSRWLFELFIKFVKWMGRKVARRGSHKEIEQEI